MRRLVVVSSLSALLASAAALAAKPKPPPPPPNCNPQIAYVDQSASSGVYTVSNADGTCVSQLYSSSNKNVTGGMKFTPTGNQIIFTENNSIKLLTYAVTSTNVSTTSITTVSTEPLQPLYVDMSPDGTHLLIVEKNTDAPTLNHYNLYVLSMIDGTRTLVADDQYNDAVWAHSNSRIAAIKGVDNGGLQTIEVYDLDVNYQIEAANTRVVFNSTVSQMNYLLRLESAHTSDTLLFNATSAGAVNVYTVDIVSNALTSVVAGWNASFNADDSAILFDGPTVANLYTLDLTTHMQTQITNENKVNATRPDFR